MRIAARAVIAAAMLCLTVSAGQAEEISYCVTCSQPAQTYLCQVSTPGGSPGTKALQLYCMVKTAKDGHHRSCSATRQPAAKCKGQIKRYTYDASGKLPGAATVARHLRNQPPVPPTAPTAAEPEKPATLFGLTSRGVKKTGDAVVKATKGAGSLVGDAARGAKRRVGNAGSAIGDAARSAYDCMKKLFRDCGEEKIEDEAATADWQPIPLTPEKAKPR